MTGGAVERSLAERYGAVLFDLDGVVYRGQERVRGAADALAEISRRGVRRLFVTNNSTRTPDEVLAKLARAGVPAEGPDVLTSAQATAAFLKREHPAGSSVFVIGGRGLRLALEGAGLTVAGGDPERTDLVVIGLDLEVTYAKLRTASLLVERGARLVATNPDTSFPASRGEVWPGAGTLTGVVVATTGVSPAVVGKPARPLFEAAGERLGENVRPLMVGDRLDTDISGASRVGLDSLLVLSGASSRADLLTAEDLPTYVGPDVSVLLEPRPPARSRPARPSEEGEVRAALGLPVDEGPPGDTVLVLEDDDGGLLAGAAIEAPAPGDRIGAAVLRWVGVRNGVRRMGLGGLAVAAAIRLRRPGSVTAEAPDEATRAFLSSIGFRSEGDRMVREFTPSGSLGRGD